jgi:hypothetical protein
MVLFIWGYWGKIKETHWAMVIFHGYVKQADGNG